MSKSSIIKPSIECIKKVLTGFDITCSTDLVLPECVGNLVNDSRAITTGDIFCAVIGHAQDGRKYIEKAIKLGATLVLAECENPDEHGQCEWQELEQEQELGLGLGQKTAQEKPKNSAVAIINFYQLNKHLFRLAKAYYNNPQAKMTMIGITGTNGKTSTSQLLGQMLSNCNKPCAIIGTNGAGRVDKLIELANTTPSATELHQYFNEFYHDNVSHIAMEASSHALEQGRVSADLFDIAVFTNLSRDHLDYHGSMVGYAAAKKLIFSHFVANKPARNHTQIAVLNGDDNQVQTWLETWPVEQHVWVYGRSEIICLQPNFVSAQHIQHHSHGVNFTLATHLGDIAVSSPLLGDFNIDNLLAAISVLMIEKLSLTEIAKQVSQVKPIDGRMESISVDGFATTVVDYAHTPDALEKALIACREHCQGKLWVVFGCGGDRDKGKRPLMAKIAENNADYLVFTNDNPRTESMQVIVDEMLVGLSDVAKDRDNVSVILDREEAVLSTLAKAKPEDIVLLAGKGHENYTVIGSEKVAYNEREIVAQFYQNKVAL
ncbi:MAG: UDP-N-acetylmuramoyl-L-alanyl-D-glutamate--2,6-diaminopimelate ligase [Colwellia sp.]